MIVAAARGEILTLESQESFVVRAPREAVWTYTSDMRNWAANMPGYESFEQISRQTPAGRSRSNSVRSNGP